MIFKALPVIKILAGIAVSLSSYTAFAASTMIIPEEIVVVSINDQKVKPGLLKSKKQFQVDAGPLLIQARYQDYFEDNLNRHDIVKSELIQLSIPQIQDQQRYRLKLLNAPQNYDAAKQYAEQPQIVLVDQNDQLIAQQSDAIVVQKKSLLNQLLGSKEEVIVSSTPTISASKTLGDQHPINSSSQRAGTLQSAAASVVTRPTSINHISADQQLKLIWQQASKQERQKFMSWLAEQ